MIVPSNPAIVACVYRRSTVQPSRTQPLPQPNYRSVHTYDCFSIRRGVIYHALVLCYTFGMRIRIRYFASLREQTGLNEELFTLPEGASVADARALLLDKYPKLRPIVERSIYAVNRNYMPLESVLHDGDELVFIPPMGGGSVG